MAGISKKRIKTKTGEKVKYTITYYDVFGKRHTSGYYETIKEAKRDLWKFELKKSNGKTLTIGDILDIYIENCKLKNRAKNTLRDYLLYRNNHLKKIENIKYDKITSYDWQNIIYDISNKISPYASIGSFRLLRAAFNHAEKFNLILTNNFKAVEPPEIPIVSHNHFEIEEMLKILEACKKTYKEFYALIFTFVGTGMREGEIFGLLKENFDDKKNIIHVCTQYTNNEFKHILKGKKRRDVYIFPALAEAIKKHIEEDKTDSPLVFHNKDGGFLNQSNIRKRVWLPLLKLCGYPENYARMHDLRGSYTDLASVLGLAITFSKDQLGHSSAITTLENYNQTNKAMIEQGMNKFEQVFTKYQQNISKKIINQNSKVIQFPKSITQTGF